MASKLKKAARAAGVLADAAAENRPSVQTQVRVSAKLNERIRAFQRKLHDETGVEITYAIAVRTLLEKGLDTQ
jgi:hypothetical protein